MPTKKLVLGEFLRARRARLKPQDVGLTPEPGRRVQGLRRDEVAERAGISVEYYVRLEQGRDHQISDQVLESLARALVLDEVSCQYLYRLALPSPGVAADSGQPRVSPSVLSMLDQWSTTPAYVFDRNQDILWANKLATAMAFGYSLEGGNLVLLHFMATDEGRLDPKWIENSRAIVAALRFYGDPDDPRMQEIVGELASRDQDFRLFWAEHEVRPFTSGVAPTYVPGFGWADLSWQALEVPGGHFLNVKLVDSGSSTAAAVAYIAARLQSPSIEE